MKIHNKIAEVAAITQHRHPERTENLLARLVVHRCSFAESPGVLRLADGDLTALQLAARFQVQDEYAPGWYTKGALPYTFLVLTNGEVDQMLPVSAVSAHALRWNVPGVGMAVAGDFRSNKAPPEQWGAAMELAAYWARYGLAIFGHDELPFASSDMKKECPGRKWPMVLFRRETRLLFVGMTKREAKEALLGAGVVF